MTSKAEIMINKLAELETKQAMVYRAKKQNKTKQKPKNTFGLDYLFYWTEIICALSFIYIALLPPTSLVLTQIKKKTSPVFPTNLFQSFRGSLDGLVKLSDVLLV